MTTGTRDDGRSYVVSVVERSGPPRTQELHEVFDGRLIIAEHDERSGELLELAPPAGCALWRVFDFSPGVLFDKHHTQSIDFDVVVDGRITLGTDEEDLDLTAGDCVLIQGDSHSWRAGPDGCRMLIAILGVTGEA